MSRDRHDALLARLDPTAKERIRASIESLERATSAEIVVAVAGLCDDYGHARARVVFPLGLLWLVAVYCFAPTLTHWLSWSWPAVLSNVPPELVLLLSSVALPLLWRLSGEPRVLRLIVPQRVRAAAVAREARARFVEYGVCDTRHRTGLLILVALGEHRVEVLADRGLHELGKEERWQEHVRTIVDAIGRGDPAAGIVAVLASVREELSGAFPAPPDNRNELSDDVRF